MQISEKIKAISFKEELIGKLVNISKKKLSWVFNFGEKEHTVALKYSLFSYKFTFSFDEKHKYKGIRGVLSTFCYEVLHNGLHFKILEGLFTFDLFINGMLFTPGSVLKPNEIQRANSFKETMHSQRNFLTESPGNKGEEIDLKVMQKMASIGHAVSSNNAPASLMVIKKKQEQFCDMGSTKNHTYSTGQNENADINQRGFKQNMIEVNNVQAYPYELKMDEQKKGISLYKKKGDVVIDNQHKCQEEKVQKIDPKPIRIFDNDQIKEPSKQRNLKKGELIFGELDLYESSRETYFKNDFEVHTSGVKYILKEMF